MTNRSLSDTIRQAREDASLFIKLESDESLRLHIVSHAKVFANIFFSTPPFDGAPKSMNVPFGAQIPGYKARPQWAFEVVNMVTGKHKILCAGTSVVEAIDKADKQFRPNDKKGEEGAGYPLFDIVLSKKGEKFGTKWTVSSAPTEYKGDGIAIINMDAEIVMTSAEILAKLPIKPPASS